MLIFPAPEGHAGIRAAPKLPSAMPRTYTLLLYHVLFSTKHRTPWITPELAERLYPFIGGIVRDEGGSLLTIGGVEDHVHLLLRFRPDDSLSNLMRNIKTRSSRWVHEHAQGLREFAWQEAYAAFTVAPSTLEKTRRYLATQREHHAKAEFVGELKQLLDKHGVGYDPRYLE